MPCMSEQVYSKCPACLNKFPRVWSVAQYWYTCMAISAIYPAAAVAEPRVYSPSGPVPGIV